MYVYIFVIVFCENNDKLAQLFPNLKSLNKYFYKNITLSLV